MISAVGLFLLVFGLQEGGEVRLGRDLGAHLGVVADHVERGGAGAVRLAVACAPAPRRWYRWNCSATATSTSNAIAAIGCSTTAMSLPMMFFFSWPAA